MADLHHPIEGNRLTCDELLAKLVGLRQAPIDQKRAPHKPRLPLLLFSQFAATGSSAASYQQAKEPASQLINDFRDQLADHDPGPAVRHCRAHSRRQQAAIDPAVR
jgi:hypothetical protein